MTVNADLHQIPIFLRRGSKIELGDLNKEWNESQAIAQTKPDLKRWIPKQRRGLRNTSKVQKVTERSERSGQAIVLVGGLDFITLTVRAADKIHFVPAFFLDF